MQRTVHTLALAAPNQTLIRRGAILFEDALSTATLPDAERLIVVRRLHLGTIDPNASAASVALQIQARYAALDSAATHASNPGAKDANIVWFGDADEPVVLLVERILHGAPAAEWFWGDALPGLAIPMPAAPHFAVEAVLYIAFRSGAPRLLALLDGLRARGLLARWLALLVPEDGVHLLQVCGWSTLFAPLPDVTPAPVESPWREALWSAAAGDSPPLRLWIAAAAIAARRPSLLAEPQRLLGLAPANVTTPGLQGEEPNSDDDTPNTGSHDAQHLLAEIPEQDAALKTVAGSSTLVAVQETPREMPLSQLQPTPSPDLPSRYAGVFLLIRVFERLGMGAFLQEHAQIEECAFPQRLLRALLDRVGAGEADPAARALALPLGLPPLPEWLPFELPAQWSALQTDAHQWREGSQVTGQLVVGREYDEIGVSAGGGAPAFRSRYALQRMARHGWRVAGDGSLALAVWQGRTPPALRSRLGDARRAPPAIYSPREVLLDAWNEAARRWLRRYADLSLEELIQRSAHIRATRSRLDCYFRAGEEEIRARLAGLDIDPGWVGWLGKSVRYHYVEPEAIPPHTGAPP